MRPIITADVDGTITRSKEQVSPGMADVIKRYVEAGGIFVFISGGTFRQIIEQVVNHLGLDEDLFDRIYVLPTSGTRMHTWNSRAKEWQTVYAHDFTDEEKNHIIEKLDSVIAKKIIPDAHQLWGPQLEERGSQITFSYLGQEAPVEEKKAWDPDKAKRKLLVAELQPLLPDYRVAYGGSTTIDITKQGVDKGTGIIEFFQNTGFNIDDAIFIGDALDPDGNDYPAYRTGIEVIKTSGPEETREIILRQLSQ